MGDLLRLSSSNESVLDAFLTRNACRHPYDLPCSHHGTEKVVDRAAVKVVLVVVEVRVALEPTQPRRSSTSADAFQKVKR